MTSVVAMMPENTPMELERFARGYSRWLIGELGMGDRTWLFHQLYETEFTWTVDRDGNRATDGIYMRDRYSYETGERLPDNWRDWPCSLAEMMASLAFTMEDSFLYNPDDDTGCDKWMREMLENCGLWWITDEKADMYPHACIEGYWEAVERVLERRYKPDGEGGLFPLERPSGDQRKEELWHQMNAYVVEKLFS